MLAHIFATALLSLTVSALVEEKRQATGAAQFTSAADQLISEYIPSTALPALKSAISSAASAASVTGEPLSLIYDALLAVSAPGWFSSAVSPWSTQIAALESNINALRATSSTSPGGPIISAGSVVTTTNSAGSTITSTLSPSSTGPTGTTVVTDTSTSGVITTKTGTLSGTGTGAADSVVSSLTTKVISGVTSIFSTAVSTLSSATSKASSGASSVAGVASTAVVGTSSSSAGGTVPTAVSGAAMGVVGILGLMVAL
ncbi:hypothetical protein BDZ45DRAFT_407025 [Acephala macrosclerotiorum]|nr:hypothetical protein BDZ45DRAFT_407025 [Acephala macrosclerotiorum]